MLLVKGNNHKKELNNSNLSRRKPTPLEILLSILQAPITAWIKVEDSNLVLQWSMPSTSVDA